MTLKARLDPKRPGVLLFGMAKTKSKKSDARTTKQITALLRSENQQREGKTRTTGNAVAQQGNKFKVAPVEARTADGIVFDSKLERRFHEVISEHLPAHQVTRQVTFTLQPSFRTTHDGKSVRGIHYRADFVFGPVGGTPEDPIPLPGSMVVDAKGMETPVFAMASKMFRHRFRQPVFALKTIKSLVAAIEQFKKITMMNQTLKDRAADGKPFTVKGYKRSDGAVVNLTLQFLPAGAYHKMAQESLETLNKDPGRVVMGDELSAYSAEDIATARNEVRSSLEKATADRDTADNTPAKVSHETLVPVCDNLSLLNGHPTHVVAFRMRTVRTEVTQMPTKLVKSRNNVTAAKKIINAKLPLHAYCHRLNLYEGNYEAIV